jgi:hypothetical protein
VTEDVKHHRCRASLETRSWQTSSAPASFLYDEQTLNSLHVITVHGRLSPSKLAGERVFCATNQ